MAVDAYLQRQLDHKIDGQLKYAYSDLCAPVPRYQVDAVAESRNVGNDARKAARPRPDVFQQQEQPDRHRGHVDRPEAPRKFEVRDEPLRRQRCV